MNYFEFYPGDYLRDTTRLTLVDHGAYLRLLIAYYSEETPLPADLGELYVITCAVSKPDKDAVKRVAERFFPVNVEDGLRHKGRVDEEIAKAQKRIAAARANGAKGGKKKEPEANPSGNPVGYPVGNPAGNPERTQPHTHSGEALHTPLAIHHQEQKTPGALTYPAGVGTDAGRACQMLRAAGCCRVNPSNPALLAALAEGVTPQALVDTYRESPDKTNPFAWAITTARNRHAEGAKPVSTGPPRSANGKPPIAQKFADKTYEGTPDEQLPAYLRPDAA